MGPTLNKGYLVSQGRTKPVSGLRESSSLRISWGYKWPAYEELRGRALGAWTVEPGASTDRPWRWACSVNSSMTPRQGRKKWTFFIMLEWLNELRCEKHSEQWHVVRAGTRGLAFERKRPTTLWVRRVVKTYFFCVFISRALCFPFL